ncbi:MAG: hypothetical protein K6G55_07315 [Selenomonadaceae bacterium]|nr:hypothetical protein [Selenomonadaceae bacterium]
MSVRKFFTVLMMISALIVSQTVYAEKSDWASSNYNFGKINTVLLLDVTVNPDLDYGGMIGLRGLQNTFRDRCRQVLNTHYKVITEDEALVILSVELNRNLEKLALENAIEARKIVMNNAWRIADAFIMGNIETWGNKKYTPSSNVNYAAVIEQRNYYDDRGHLNHERVLIPLPAQYLPEDTDVPAIGIIMRAYETGNETVIFERYEMRIRRPQEAQTEMFGEMCTQFAESFMSKR